jgi:hypothetical protein
MRPEVSGAREMAVKGEAELMIDQVVVKCWLVWPGIVHTMRSKYGALLTRLSRVHAISMLLKKTIISHYVYS